MAPKQAEKIEKPPVASSSEEEEEESGSSGEESESSDDEGDVQSKISQTTPATITAKDFESDSEEGESESDSDSEPTTTKTKPLNTVVTKPKPETSGSAAVTLPESSTAKRSLKQADDEPIKKLKTSTTEHAKKKPATDDEVKKISGEEAKKMFQRLFSETDEIAMLQGFLDFTSTRGDPYENMDAFCDYVKTLIDFNASKAQIVTKLQRCKRRFVNIGKTEIGVMLQDLDQKAFELSRKIWGTNGVFPAKPRKKSKETKLLPSASPTHTRKEEKPMANALNTHLSSSGEIASFFKAENVSVFGLDESTVSGNWDLVPDGPKKREMEEKLKKLKDTQVELCLQRTELVDTTAKMIYKDYASSSC
ncbi:hypothetical protein EUTSA_v10027016mg [Eutrema salsugineum]|uniref:Uncharacterized protein n=1 Tax=Eutrema salsugineum TaxID=72664 RepID=V4MHI7_EUTSA|nr:hypothetical protein EUTSA_v10027016mg [Eutrema salsugineum]